MTTNKSKNKLSQIFFDSLFFFSKKDVIIVLTASSYSNNNYSVSNCTVCLQTRCEASVQDYCRFNLVIFHQPHQQFQVEHILLLSSIYHDVIIVFHG